MPGGPGAPSLPFAPAGPGGPGGPPGSPGGPGGPSAPRGPCGPAGMASMRSLRPLNWARSSWALICTLLGGRLGSKGMAGESLPLMMMVDGCWQWLANHRQQRVAPSTTANHRQRSRSELRARSSSPDHSRHQARWSRCRARAATRAGRWSGLSASCTKWLVAPSSSTGRQSGASW